jgi:multidrug efflux pump subunit AcrA (membrane-fusion protein)
MKIRMMPLIGFCLPLAGLAVGGAWLRSGRPAAQPLPAASVRVHRERFVRSLFVSGELAAVQSRRVVTPPFRGRGPFAIKALAPEGAHVEPGDLLVQIDNSTLVDLLETEELNLEKAQNELVKKQAELEIQVKDLELELGQKKLELDKAQLKAEIPKSLLALRDWQDNQFNYQKARKEWEKTTKSLGLAQKAAREETDLFRIKQEQSNAQVTHLKNDIAAFEIRADRPGTVIYEIFPPSRWMGDAPRKLQVGDQVEFGWMLLSLPDLDRMEVLASVSEVDGGLVRTGQRVRVVADAHPDREFAGTVDSVPGLAERPGKAMNVRVFKTTVKLEATDAELMRPGMSVRAEIVLRDEEGLVLPRRVVFEEKGKAFVRTAAGRTEIRLRDRNEVACLVDGIPEGTEVQP